MQVPVTLRSSVDEPLLVGRASPPLSACVRAARLHAFAARRRIASWHGLRTDGDTDADPASEGLDRVWGDQFVSDVALTTRGAPS